MGRDERMIHILAEARQHFARHGFQAAVVSDIAKGAGVSEATVFKYFPSKLDLLNSVIESWYSELFRDYSKELAFVSGARERARFLIWRHLNTLHGDPQMCRLMLSDVRMQPGYEKSVLFRMNQRYTGLFMQVIRDGVSEGVFRDDISVELIRDMVFGGMEHHAWSYLFGKGSLDVEAVTHQLTSAICAGIESAAPASDQAQVRRLSGIAANLQKEVDRMTQKKRRPS